MSMPMKVIRAVVSPKIDKTFYIFNRGSTKYHKVGIHILLKTFLMEFCGPTYVLFISLTLSDPQNKTQV